MNPSTSAARTLLAELAGQGVRHVVLCPGSRSAPLALAAVAAQRSGLVEVHVRIDERSAAFLALGLAKATRVPAAVVTTSGTAVANLHPAVLEAHHGQVPLVVISADRPPELRGTGANQVTDQPGIFGSAVRWSADLPTPDGTPLTTAAWRTGAARAVAAATGALGSGGAGPVHLNAPLREPLVDDDAPEVVDAPEPLSIARSAITAAAPIPHVDRTLVVIGDLPDPAWSGVAVDWAVRRGYPVVAEPFGEHDRCAVLPHAPLFLASSWLETHLPQRVLVVGRPTLTRAVGALLRHRQVRVETVVAGLPWSDPGHVAAAVYPWAAMTADAMGVDALGVDALVIEGTDAGSAPGTDAGSDAGTDAWASDWTEAGRVAAHAVDAVLSEAPDGSGGALSGPRVARTVLAHLPAGARLFVGSSNPVRDLDVAAAPRHDTAPGTVQIVASRGLAGIDGCLATTFGLALADDRPTYALVGDLTFLHDTNALVIGPTERRPNVTIIVPNDDGGGIFTTLEYGDPQRARDFERAFGTPTGTDLGALCAAHGIDHVRVTDSAALAAAVAPPPTGLRVIEVPVRRSGHRDLHARLRAAVDTALAIAAVNPTGSR